MPNHRLVVEYDGTDFGGWQRQPGTRTVQGMLEAALRQVTGVATDVQGAGRTDAGVHAEGQVAHARLETPLGLDRMRHSLNGVLPCDVAVRSLSVAPDAFDARRNARSKLYRYRLWTGATRSPLRERFALWVRSPRDLEAMRCFGAALLGRHDFASFQATGSAAGPTVRTLFRCEVLGGWGGDVAIEIEGDGFLRHMVRNIVGTLLEVGRGRLDPRGAGALLAARDRRLAGPNVPARGLCLVRVDYADFPAESKGLGLPAG